MMRSIYITKTVLGETCHFAGAIELMTVKRLDISVFRPATYHNRLTVLSPKTTPTSAIAKRSVMQIAGIVIASYMDGEYCSMQVATSETR